MPAAKSLSTTWQINWLSAQEEKATITLSPPLTRIWLEVSPKWNSDCGTLATIIYSKYYSRSKFINAMKLSLASHVTCYIS